ncbi:hypothetical protein RchiOBHm_Chr4g0402571 [Rosa chinensis]|uniref:Syntaxin 6/10/61 N-terminal domain-containing protein n=1 Tax=Rosa chinensis TaxID=74649 RepID=A0A2P6QTC0_ROSCH|nr:uncharacterized protein LOC112197720 [Rosa chinensis]PRQ37435.1 hypothetical protein RchiOBHm_Chr4g0402571 [Rosa chinensis]
MLVANSFDLWKKDVFFPAAEEVQESADIMESTYRAWARERRESVAPEDLDELCRELQTALGTAKWQLEEFEKAVRLSYRQRGDDHTTARHRQFISAIENQISHVETALSASFSAEGKKHLRWVELDEEECDDLAAFLSGTSHCIPSAKNDHVELGPSVKSSEEKPMRRKEVDIKSNAACNLDISDEIKGVKDTAINIKDPNFIMDLSGKEMPGTRDDIVYHADRTTNTRKTWGSPNCELRIIVADEAEQRTQVMPSLEDTPKEKGSKLVFWRSCGEFHQAKGAVNLFNQLFGRVGASQKQSQSPQKRWQGPLRLHYGRSVQVTLVLMLTFFLLVPFVFYSS